MTVATTVEADPEVPVIRITRDFAATPDQMIRVHTDPELFARWVGPDSSEVRIDHWDARNGGSYRYVDREQGFRGCFHEVSGDRIVQTFTWEGAPRQVALETTTFTDLGGGRTRMVAESLCDSFAVRDQWLAGGMQTGMEQGYAKLDALLAGMPAAESVG